jgi:hypothetical protein
MHAMFYSSDAQALRAFLKDKVGLKGTDVGDGWLIFDAPEARGRGVEFTQEVEDHGYGLVTFFKVPGAFKVQLYQARYSK